MRALSMLLFIFLLPFLGALGHDIYLSFKEQDFTKPMMFSDVGYLWTQYLPDSYKTAKDEIAPETWDAYVAPFLEQTTLVVTAIPLVLLFIAIVAIKFVNTSTFAPKGKGKGFAFNSGGETGKTKFHYKRKR